MAIAPLVVSGGEHLARLDEHFADMLVAVIRGRDGRGMMEIEHVHKNTFQQSTGRGDIIHQSREFASTGTPHQKV